MSESGPSVMRGAPGEGARRLPIAREGLPFVIAPLGAALILAAAGFWIAAGAFAVVALACALFFRDPERRAPVDPTLVVAPADGRVTVVAETTEGLHIAIFLSVFDVHVNRAPVAGVITRSTHRNGRFLAAFRPEAGSENERHDVTIETDRGSVHVAQIAGLIARRIVCRLVPGHEVTRGQRFGLIRFGSRTDVVLPFGARALVVPGDRVRGGETPVARWEDDRGAP